MTGPTFQKLNLDWNADPNVPDPQVEVHGGDLLLTFHLNHYIFDAVEGETGCLRFINCGVWRHDITNDHAWYNGEGRFALTAPAWGEFYEVFADNEAFQQDGWHHLRADAFNGRHYIFYFRDEAYECFAQDCSFERSAPARQVAALPKPSKRSLAMLLWKLISRA